MNIKKLFITVLCAVMISSFCACGKKEKKESSLDYAYHIESLKVDGIPDEVNLIREFSDVIWLIGIKNEQTCLGHFTIANSDYQEISLELPENERLVDFYINSEEMITIITSETKAEQQQYFETLRLYQCTKEGKEFQMLSELKDCESNYQLCMTENLIYLVEDGIYISVFDKKGVQKESSESRKQIQAICENGKECYYIAIGIASSNMVVGTIEPDGTAEEKGEIDIWLIDDAYLFPSKNQKEEFFFKDRTGIYNINSKAVSDRTLSWDSFDILGSGLSSVLSLENEGFLCWDSKNRCFLRIIKGEKQSAEETEDTEDAIEEIVFASDHIQDCDRERVFRFNEEHDDCKIIIRDYSVFDNPNDQFNLDVASGDIPDIINSYLRDPIMLAEKGMFTDLSVFMEQDPEVSKEDLQDSVVKLLEMDGNIYFLPTHFMVEALVGSKDDIGNRDRWTLEEFEIFCEEKKAEGAEEIITGMNNVAFPGFNARFTMEDYIDLNTGTVNFLTEDFQKLLSISKKYFPEKVDLSIRSNQRIKNGTAFLRDLNFMSFFQCAEYQWMFKKNGYSFIGYPSKDASHFGIGMRIEEYFGIAEKCKKKEEAWEFLRQYFLKDYFLNYEDQRPNSIGFSIRKDIMEYDKECAMAKKEYTNEKEEKITPMLKDKYVDLGDGIKAKTKPLKKKEIQQVEELINHMDILSMNTSIYFSASCMIQEEVLTGFGDDKSIEEIMDIIQRRISIMVSEQS